MNVAPTFAIEAKHEDDDLWFKDAIIYQLHVKAFSDGNHDGVGDFTGLTQKLDYLQDLGVTALWLLPFYPSPGRDDGYDIADYGRINPQFGEMKDFRRFMAEAKRRDLRVITELVVNHTSDEHAWFKRARRSPAGSSARDWYVWSDTDQKFLETRIIFTDTEKSNWAWDPEAKAYYWHRFFSHQPDLNFDNPRVLSAVIQVMKRWLDMGVDGFRLDAIPYLVERDGTNNENLPETHDVIKQIRAALDAYAPGRVLLAEANQWPEDVRAYFGEGDECHMAYHFPLMPRIFMAIAQEDRFPIADILRQTPDIPANCQWAMFLRNHDELTLEMVTDVERDYLWSTYANDPRARINLGIRRRLAPLMDNDRRKIELMNSILMSMPGTPIIYYGDEIGMGDNIYLGDRNGVRTPMQWTSDRNGGFSRCDPARLYLPTIMDSVYGYEAVNVEAQSRSLSSLLSWTKRLIGVRKTSQVFGRGTLSFIRPANRSVLVYAREYQGETVLCVANLSRSAQAVEIDLSRWEGSVPIEMLGRAAFPPIGVLPYLVTLAPYGFFWFLLCESTAVAPETQPVEYETLVIKANDSIVNSRARGIMERDVLPGYLARRRWFSEHDPRNVSASIQALVPVTPPDPRIDVAVVETRTPTETALHVVPLGLRWTRFARENTDPTMLAAVRQGPREGTLRDAATDEAFIRAILTKLRAGETTHEVGERAILGDYEFAYKPTGRFLASPERPIEKVRAVQTEQSNTTALVGSDYVVKVFRKLVWGVNPEAEVGQFLTETTPFANTPALLGVVEASHDGKRGIVAVVHQLVENQGDAWTVTSGYLDRFIEEQRLLDTTETSDELPSYLRTVEHIGERVAEMQRALASRSDIADFAPEPVTADDVAGWSADLLRRASGTIDDLARRRSDFREDDLALIDQLIAQRDALPARIASLLSETDGTLKCRHHGDFHLGQMLVVKDDIFIIDFEGEPRRSMEERRRKAPAARDVAGLIRSLDYSATAAFERSLKAGADDQGKVERALGEWRDEATSTFLETYHRTLGQGPLWPKGRAAHRMLDFFLLEKAFYEIEYELAHRLDWLRVPLAGTLRILSQRQEKA